MLSDAIALSISSQDGLILLHCRAFAPNALLLFINSWFCWVFFFFTYTLDLCYIMNGHWYDDLDQLFHVAVSHHNTGKHIFSFSFSTPSLLPLLLLQGKYPENSKSFS